ncbi:ATPase AAA [Cerasicoccus arenae]|uniref:ATPase AAA n=2 Tax=Cerasicoccus arenae TaxID=424488 RepID=A0A8J3GCM8_9BACT|nr:ATPase AAA [Cerasicoccus arenae]
MIVMLSGPNGAGKSTFYEAYLSGYDAPFLNADVLASVSGLDAYTAARQVAALRDDYLGRKESFITETVFSDPVGDKVNFLKRAVEASYDVRLIYIGIESSNMSVQRVATRVKAGGHDVPVDKLLARYDRTLANLERAIQILPWVNIYDNGSMKSPYRLLAKFRDGQLAFRCDGEIPTWARRFL